MINLNNTKYLDQPYSVGNEKWLLPMGMLTPVVKTLSINSIYREVYPWVKIHNNIPVRILTINISEIEEIQKRLPAEKFPRLSQQVPLAFNGED